MKKQFIDYAVYKADHSGISAANNFYTHRAEITKQKNRYLLTLKVKVKHGLVKFQPLQMSLGKIVNITCIMYCIVASLLWPHPELNPNMYGITGQ